MRRDQPMSLVLGCFVAFMASQGIGCTPEPLPPSTHPGCPGACEQGAALSCTWADSGCVDFCSAYHAVGYMRPWADCVGKAGSVEAVQSCGMSCR